jgi:hypothetical protein
MKDYEAIRNSFENNRKTLINNIKDRFNWLIEYIKDDHPKYVGTYNGYNYYIELVDYSGGDANIGDFYIRKENLQKKELPMKLLDEYKKYDILLEILERLEKQCESFMIAILYSRNKEFDVQKDKKEGIFITFNNRRINFTDLPFHEQKEIINKIK